MMKRVFFLPLLLIVCLLAPVPAAPAETRNTISLAGNALKVVPPIPDFSASNPVPFGRPDDDFESRYRMVRFFQPHQPVHFVQQIAGRNAKPRPGRMIIRAFGSRLAFSSLFRYSSLLAGNGLY